MSLTAGSVSLALVAIVASSAGALGQLTTAAAATASPSPSPTALQSSAVHIDLESTATRAHLPNSTLTLIADLEPAAAWGSVTLYDGETKVASGANYRYRWSWSTSSMSVGRHVLSVHFDPAPASGYAPSHGSAPYVVVAPPAAPVVVVKHTKDPQPIVVTIPSVKATKTSRPTKSATPSSSPTPTGGVLPTSAGLHHAGPKGPMPMTGLDLAALIGVAGVLLGGGALFLRLGRRRKGAHVA
ncbi:MAG: hypothetical protein JO246_10580 [Frankiaceae bacterium]|nr:hypothetical protein [Frankiaceae bacterium]MBV9869948.1 hypothetical protein [Frankiaceae bacterium]